LNKLPLLQPVYNNEGFMGVANEVLNTLFLSILQNELASLGGGAVGGTISNSNSGGNLNSEADNSQYFEA
jgi:hypothetical protein